MTGASLSRGPAPGAVREDGRSCHPHRSTTLTRPKADGGTGRPTRSCALNLQEGSAYNRNVSVRPGGVLIPPQPGRWSPPAVLQDFAVERDLSVANHGRVPGTLRTGGAAERTCPGLRPSPARRLTVARADRLVRVSQPCRKVLGYNRNESVRGDGAAHPSPPEAPGVRLPRWSEDQPAVGGSRR